VRFGLLNEDVVKCLSVLTTAVASDVFPVSQYSHVNSYWFKSEASVSDRLVGVYGGGGRGGGGCGRSA
jgi:hypothetical protein